jgi:hypothetical protein
MVTGIHRPLNVVEFNASGIGRQRHQLSKQLKDQYIDMILFSETHLKPRKKFFIQNYHLSNRRPPGQKRQNCLCS